MTKPIDPNNPKTRKAVNEWGQRMLKASEGFEHSGAYTGSQVDNRKLSQESIVKFAKKTKEKSKDFTHDGVYAGKTIDDKK